MDTKRLISMMMLSFAVILGYQLLVNHFFGPPRKIGGNATTQSATSGPATQVATTQEIQSIAATTQAASSQPAPQMTQAAVHVVAPATQPTVATIGVDAAYPMIVKINSGGAGLDSVTLKEFKNPQQDGDYVFQEPYTTGDANTRSLATRSITLNGTEVSLTNINWTLEKESADTATFVVDLGQAKLRKIFQVRAKLENGNKTFDLVVRHEIENTGKDAAKVKLVFNGTNTPPHEAEQGRDVQMISGYDNDLRVAVKHHYTEEFDTKHPTLDLTKGDDNTPLLWAGTSSNYFNAIVRPEPLDPTSVDPKYITKLEFAALNPDSVPHDRQVATTLEIGEQTIDAGKSLTIGNTVYLGPRWRAVLNHGKYAQFPLKYDDTLIMSSGICGYCAFPFLINGLVWLLSAFHAIFRDWGLAIIALVLLVRAILHPITKRSQVSMMKMGKLGPEVERLKKKYGDDKDELNRQMMGLYKDQGIGMYLGCAPMFLQMPIWIALWSALQSTFELRQAPFLYGWTWIHDLSKPDALVHFNTPIPLLFGWHLASINVLPLCMMVVTWINQKYMPQPPASTPEQEQQQKMMKWMSMLFPLMFYSFPSGLNLYYVTSMGLGIIESKRIRAHIKEQEEAEKAGRIFVEPTKAMKKKQRDDDEGGAAAKSKQPKTGPAGWLARLQDKAEELKNHADKDKGKK